MNLFVEFLLVKVNNQYYYRVVEDELIDAIPPEEDN